MDELAPFEEAIDLIKEAGGDAFKLCWQCGLCSASCPWNMVRTFMPHKMICQSRYGLVELEDAEWWLCSTCNLCVSRCPRGVAITDIIRAIRKIMLEFQFEKAPASLRSAVGNLRGQGNPWGNERSKRALWAENLGIQPYSSEDHDVLYFPCCVPAYDAKLGSVARATALLLQATGARFGILGEKENCCGESVRKAGHESLFESLMQGNLAVFKENRIREIIVTSPHCLTTFTQEYPGLKGETKILHMTQYLADLLERGKLSLEKGLRKKIIYHDPCYLGRHNGIYEEPRKVLGSIPGVTLMDEAESRENSLCCGGGGARIWMETLKGQRFSDILVDQAVEMGADMLVTACPYCLLNFKDSVVTSDKVGMLEVKDVSEVVLEAIGE
ncbi:MAG: (Fe-S)-binding protein, partial [Deltaproteobacteria bacterium]|nr:(Fe-S)-binding protein [Deltaproteobacteria bacterium]